MFEPKGSPSLQSVLFWRKNWGKNTNMGAECLKRSGRKSSSDRTYCTMYMTFFTVLRAFFIPWRNMGTLHFKKPSKGLATKCVRNCEIHIPVRCFVAVPFVSDVWCLLSHQASFEAGPFVAGPFVAGSFVSRTFRSRTFRPISLLWWGTRKNFVTGVEPFFDSRDGRPPPLRETKNVLLHLIRMSNFSVSCCWELYSMCNAHRLNIELDLQILFGIHVHSCTH